MSNLELALRLFGQLTLILVVCRSVGWLGRRFLGQTQVVMEMVAGVMLGPSLLGLVAPELQAWLFPRELVVEAAGGAAVVVQHPSMGVLFALSQLGLVLYMFLVGLEFDLGLLRRRLGSAGLISAAGIIVPFALGAALTWVALDRGDLFSPRLSPSIAALFLGASMSITAFPMLARILYERGLTGTRLGTVALAAGAFDDAMAWCLLAVVLAAFNAAPGTAVLTVAGGALYGVAMMVLARPLLRRFERGFAAGGELGADRYSLLLAVVTLCALVTDAIGIYAVFGAFVAGIAMPRGAFARAVAERTEAITTSLLLPIFFVYSGLNTRIGLVATAELAALTAVVVLVAIAGKGVACTLAARAGGEGWRDAAVIGTLMNARGLMELILLNVGLEHGVITPTLFTILVLMAVVTTLIASPLYSLLTRRSTVAAAAEEGTIAV